MGTHTKIFKNKIIIVIKTPHRRPCARRGSPVPGRHGGSPQGSGVAPKAERFGAFSLWFCRWEAEGRSADGCPSGQLPWLARNEFPSPFGAPLLPAGSCRLMGPRLPSAAQNPQRLPRPPPGLHTSGGAGDFDAPLKPWEKPCRGGAHRPPHSWPRSAASRSWLVRCVH